jgi:hypothetical protein
MKKGLWLILLNTLQYIFNKRDSVTRWIFFRRSKHFNHYRTFCVCADGFQGLLKAFHYPIQLLTVYLLLRNYLLIRKMLFWNPSQNSLFYYWSMSSSADISLAAGKTHKNCLVTWGFRYDFTEPQTASCMHFQCQYSCFRVFEAGYCKDFKISKQF